MLSHSERSMLTLRLHMLINRTIVTLIAMTVCRVVCVNMEKWWLAIAKSKDFCKKTFHNISHNEQKKNEKTTFFAAMTSTNSSGQWNTWQNCLYSDAEYSDQSQVLMYRLESPWQIIQMQLMTTIHRSRSLPACHSQFITIFIAFDFTWSYSNTFTQTKNAFAQN